MSLPRSRPITWSTDNLALGQRLQRDEDKAGIGLAAAGEADDAVDRRVLADDVDELVSFCCISWNEMLWSAWMPPIIRPVSCCGKKPFGMIDEQIDVEADRRRQDSAMTSAG